jgi:hypothetical protein
VKKLFSAIAIFFVATLSNAALVAQDADGDGKLAFFDSATNLLWTNGNVFSNAGLTYTIADSIVKTATFENLAAGAWRLPTLAEFTSLYVAQQSVSAIGGGSKNWGDMTVNANWYWTTDKPNPESLQNFAFSPFNPVPQGQLYNDSQNVGVWAVTAVPEPESYAMMLAGLGLMVAVASRRKAKQSA